MSRGTFRANLHVQAYRVRVQQMVDTAFGTRTAMPGDWIMTNVAGRDMVVSDRRFREDFEPADDAATTMWDEDKKATG